MVEVSSADRVVFPEVGITKGEVVDYYARVGDRMLAHSGGRPLTLQRYPKGLAGEGFMQKNTPSHYPDWIERFEAPKQDGTTTYPVARTAEAFAYLANQGTITFHAWTSAVEHPWIPDRLIIDLDPPAGEIELVKAAATASKNLLDDFGVQTVPMATGSKGYHLVASIVPEHDFEEVAAFSQGCAALLVEAMPDLLTTEFRIENREGRVFVDWLRNRWGSTGVVAWSLRPRPSATVAVPFEWSELDTIKPDQWTLRTLGDRLELADPLLEQAEAPIDISSAIAAMGDRLTDAGIALEGFDRFRS